MTWRHLKALIQIDSENADEWVEMWLKNQFYPICWV
jgi:hypothetical protein